MARKAEPSQDERDSKRQKPDNDGDSFPMLVWNALTLGASNAVVLTLSHLHRSSTVGWCSSTKARADSAVQAPGQGLHAEGCRPKVSAILRKEIRL